VVPAAAIEAIASSARQKIRAARGVVVGIGLSSAARLVVEDYVSHFGRRHAVARRPSDGASRALPARFEMLQSSTDNRARRGRFRWE